MSDLITKADVEIMEKQTPETLAEWSCALNRWEWPSELPDPETKNGPNKRRLAIMDWIDNKVGEKLVYKVWNKGRMTSEEFEEFWLIMVKFLRGRKA